MASSSGNMKYPPRLYEIGKTPIQSRSMNHSCFLGNLQTLKEKVGEDVWVELRESAVGVIIKLKELEYTWSAKSVHYFLVNQLAIQSSHEVWSLIENQPMRFSLYEFEDITGLNCDLFDTQEQWNVAHEDFWVEMKVPISEGPKLNELQALFPSLSNWPREKRVMVGLLFLLSIGIFGISSNSRIPLHLAKRVMDPAAFKRYPWGRVAFTSLVDSIKVVTYERKRSYTLRGCVHALLIWIYESVQGLGEIYGHRIEEAEVPLLSWHGSRPRINFPNFCAQEKKNYQKIRVRHMIVKAMEDRYPKWDEDEPPHEDLDNMIVDILNHQLNDKYWDVAQPTKLPKRKTHVTAPSVPDRVDESPSTKRKKEKETAPEMEESHTDMPIINITIQKLLEAVNNLSGRLETMDVSVAERVTKTLEASVQAQMEARMVSFETEFKNKIAILQEEINVLKAKDNEKIPSNVGNSKAHDEDSRAHDEDDACSNSMTKKSSVDGLPIQCVIKKEKNKKAMSVKIEEVPLKKVKTEKSFAIPQLNDQSVSTEGGWESHLKWQQSVTCRLALEALASNLEEPTRKRKTQLTKTQMPPYVGNSTVKRIITAKTVSKESYDPLANVDQRKLQKLLEFIKSDLEDSESGYGDRSASFFLTLIIPREVWPTKTYGWLHDSHMAAAMRMFHRRSMQSQSPFSSSRIAFLDRWFVKSWVIDYKKFDETNELPEYLSMAYNGEYPADFKTGKKWLKDVDSLFLCHHVNGDHWIALHIELQKGLIHVYDSIRTWVSDKKMQEECRPFTKMIPVLLKKMDPKLRAKLDKPFTYRRYNNIPQNEDPGDCGVYTLKYIECLALGYKFEGLSDQIIQPMRLKMAAEIYDEVAMED
ncbi:Ulp1 protease family [Hirschfeldia incana]|nr:Ulp1 protease family [Hirschfeldia incana]